MGPAIGSEQRKSRSESPLELEIERVEGRLSVLSRIQNAAQVRKRDGVRRYPVQHAGSGRRVGVVALGEALALRADISHFRQPVLEYRLLNGGFIHISARLPA